MQNILETSADEIDLRFADLSGLNNAAANELNKNKKHNLVFKKRIKI